MARTLDPSLKYRNSGGWYKYIGSLYGRGSFGHTQPKAARDSNLVVCSDNMSGRISQFPETVSLIRSQERLTLIFSSAEFQTCKVNSSPLTVTMSSGIPSYLNTSLKMTSDVSIVVVSLVSRTK